MTRLQTFPAPLLRLILCGGGGLPPAWGPLQGGLYGPRWTWDPERGVAGIYGPEEIRCGFHGVLDCPETWHFPLDASSPWPARLALVAAWMLIPACKWRPESAAQVVGWTRDVAIYYWGGAGFTARWTWGRDATVDPSHDWPGQMCEAPLMPTFTTHLAEHPLAVALLLALYDVPEIRARVERS